MENSSQSVSFIRGTLDYDEQRVSKRGDRCALQQQSRSTVNKTKKINQSRKQIIKVDLEEEQIKKNKLGLSSA